MSRWFAVPGEPRSGSPPASAANNGLYSVFPATITRPVAAPVVQLPRQPGFGHQRRSHSHEPDSSNPVAFKLYPLTPSTGKEADSALNPPQDPLRTVGSWTQLSDLEFTLPAHTLANVPFTLKIPAGETPGDYAGGIVLSPVNPATETRGYVTFNVYNNVGARIYVRVRGPLHPGLSITHLSINTSGFAGYVGGPVSSTVTYTLTNTGNQILNPTAKLSVSPLVGSATKIPPRIFSSLLPQNSVTVSYQLPSKEAFLRLEAHLTVTSAAGTTSATATAWIIPWIVVAIIVFIIGFFWYRRRRRRALATGAGAIVVGGAEPLVAASGWVDVRINQRRLSGVHRRRCVVVSRRLKDSSDEGCQADVADSRVACLHMALFTTSMSQAHERPQNPRIRSRLLSGTRRSLAAPSCSPPAGARARAIRAVRQLLGPQKPVRATLQSVRL